MQKNTFRCFFLTLIFYLVLLTVKPASAATIMLTGTIRDFSDSHPDFEVGSFNTDETGIVLPTLGIDGKPVYGNHPMGTLTTTGQTEFDQWYRDVMGVNLSQPLTITLDNTITPDPSVFTIDDSSFFPIDGMLLGNEGRFHNFHFTFELHTNFVYQLGQSFTFTGDDDMFVFIDNQLVIDLGGVHQPLTDTVDLDTLGLTPGLTYNLDLFFAERRTNQSNFRIDTSIPTLSSMVCGDGVVDAGEGCDDGNTLSGDGCSSSCQIEVCGNAILDPGESCDDGNTVGGDGCSATCQTEACGNSVVDIGEGCDDGNTIGGDGCSATCQLEACGNSVVDVGESCDDGNTTGGDGCNAVCQLENCGNSIVDVGETCDDGNTIGGDGCSGVCQVEICGNSTVDPGETCDDGNTVGGDGCSATCQAEVCGNGVLDTGEECDDGNTLGGDGCGATCLNELCGNGVVDLGETCDDGNTVNGDGCSSICMTEPAMITVDIEIMPGKDLKCAKINDVGVIRVAVLGSQVLDVSRIDTASISFAGLSPAPGPDCSIADVGGPGSSAADGHNDLLCRFTDDSGNFSAPGKVATLTGPLLGGFTVITGTGTICLLP